ncbi:uncharacterized protein LOC127849725 [Dreissena polymorpha]|uniref:uncharacterized protein LOC127849725 n=1 Tax=Dreissena polymorpha TaxID=45954 RepID=UPI002264D027|nr:uncharacterized protein LOC127849725 [Dreissena polymorpha]
MEGMNETEANNTTVTVIPISPRMRSLFDINYNPGVIYVLVITLLSIAGIAGNSAIIYVMKKEPQVKGHVRILMSNMALADLCVTGIANPMCIIAQATVSFNFNDAEANILFDEGAQRSFITKELAEKLNIVPDSTEEMSISSFRSTANQVQHIESATIYLPAEENGCNFEISLLIRADHYWNVVEDDVIRGDGPTAVKSKIGYLLSGSLHSIYPNRTMKTVLNVMMPQSHKSEEMALERFWNLESIGINAAEKNETAIEYLQNYQNNFISFSDGKYCAKLPWKQYHPSLPSNYGVAMRRTEATIKRLSEDPFILQKYGQIIAEQERRGFIEKVADDSQPSQQVHYIPHHGVKKDSLTTPIRLVYDCSCRQARESPSLNDCLESTPPIVNDLTAILLRFRTHQYAVDTDIEKAFLNVRLHENDRDSTRFFWLSNPQRP